MISTGDPSSDPLARDRLLVIGGPSSASPAADVLTRRFSDWAVVSCDTYLAGIVELSHRGARAVLAHVDPTCTQLGHAVAGLREAAGPDARLILCCPPAYEPLTRSVVHHGADDYILSPLEPADLDQLVTDPTAPRVCPAGLTAAPAASMEELSRLADLLSRLDDNPLSLLKRVADLVRTALGAEGTSVVVEGAVASTGRTVERPVISAPLHRGDRVIGQLTLGPRSDGAYTPADMRKLTHYATVIGHVLRAASAQRDWRKLSFTDDCSGLPNRRYFARRLDETLSLAAKGRFHVSVLLFDIDDFKTYNDRYGHDAGDEIIRLTGELFRKHCREQDVVARYGGDEFAVMFWDPKGPRVAGSRDIKSALAVLQRFSEALKTQRFERLGASGTGRLTISGGLATYPWDGTTRAELIHRADEALLAAKRAGKNRIFLIGEDQTSENAPSAPSPR